MKKMDAKDLNVITNIFKTAYTSVCPKRIIANSLHLDSDVLTINNESYILKKNVYIIAFGKAVLGMIRSVQEILHCHIVGGVCSLPYGIIKSMTLNKIEDIIPYLDDNLKIFEGAFENLPDKTSVEASQQIYNLLQQLKEKDIVLVLMSGGGSALLSLPEESVSLYDLQQLTLLMSRSGASIDQLNALRKNIEVLKGGGISRIAYPAKVIGLILSDVIGDDLEYICSGPTVPNNTTPIQCIQILKKLNILDTVPTSIKTLLQIKLNKSDVAIDAASSSSTKVLNDITILNNNFCNTQNVIVGSNTIAVEAAVQHVSQIGLKCTVLTCMAKGEANDWALFYSRLARHCLATINKRDLDTDSILKDQCKVLGINSNKFDEINSILKDDLFSGLCIISAGETTVHVQGKGKGGRNQHMVLRYTMEMRPWLTDVALASNIRINFLSCGTDGQDGPTDAAGAYIDVESIRHADESIMKSHLDNYDSYTFFESFAGGKHHVKTGLTGTNVMDLQILLIQNYN